MNKYLIGYAAIASIVCFWLAFSNFGYGDKIQALEEEKQEVIKQRNHFESRADSFESESLRILHRADSISQLFVEEHKTSERLKRQLRNNEIRNNITTMDSTDKIRIFTNYLDRRRLQRDSSNNGRE